MKVNKFFSDDHVLKPVVESNSEFTSTDDCGSHCYKIENKTIRLKNDDETEDTTYQVNILSVEKGYNKEFQPYNIIIVEKPLHSKYQNVTTESQHNKLQLNRFISSYKE